MEDPVDEFQAEPHRVTGFDGVALNVWDFGGDGPPLLLCHCTGTHARMWDPLLPRLLEHFHVYASDTRGHGDSEIPDDPDAFVWPNSGRDLLAVIDALDLGTGIVAAGHSAGASHICYAEMLRPGTFSKTVLIDPIIGPKEAFQGDNPLAAASRRRKNDFNSLQEARDRYLSKAPMNAWHPDALDAYVNYGFNPRDDGTVTLKCPGTIEATVYERSGACDVFEALPNLELRPMLVTSDGSDVRQLAELQRERFRDPEYRVIEGASHFIPQEKPEEVTELILEWLT